MSTTTPYPGAEFADRFGAWLADIPAAEPLVIFLADDPHADFAARVARVRATLPAQTPLFAISADDTIPAEATPASPTIRYLARHNTDFATLANACATLARPRDLVFLRDGIALPPDWLGTLRAAAYARSTIATASPLDTAMGDLSVLRGDAAFPPGMAVDEANARVRRASQRLYPIIPAVSDYCCYIRRTAIETVGAFTPPGDEALHDFAQRAVMHGYGNVVADDLIVAPQTPRTRAGTSPTMAGRYPWLPTWQGQIERGDSPPLLRALERARAAIVGYRIAIDATMLAAHGTGMRVVILELLHALATTPGREVHLTVILGEHARPDFLLGTEQRVDAVVNVATLRRVREPIFDLVHRPAQVQFPDDFLLLRRIARRVVVTQLDFIMYANPSYFPTADEWLTHRRYVEETHRCADGIAYLSEDARQDAVHQGLGLSSERTCIMYAGVDHPLMTRQVAGRDPDEGVPSDFPVPTDRPFLLVLGNTFRHKNRRYAIRLFKELAATRDWPGHLVLAGPRIPFGSSEAEEAADAAAEARFAGRIHHLGAVSDGEKRWLLRHAALVLYPSIVEGFGLVPFEAAALGTPALALRGTALAELLGDAVRYLDGDNPLRSVAVAWSLLADPAAAAAQVAAIEARAAHFTWERVAGILWEFYDRTLAAPPRAAFEAPPSETGRLAEARHFAAVIMSDQLNPHVPRPVQLLQRTRVMLREEGGVAVAVRLARWLRGERRYHHRPPRD